MIRYSYSRGTEFYVPSKFDDKESVRHAAIAFGFLLNTSDHQGRWHSWNEFAAMISTHCQHPQAAALVEILRAA